MNIIMWNISLIEFICKFCDDKDLKLKLKFKAFDDEVNAFVIKTLIIDETNYIPDELRGLDVIKIGSDDYYTVIKLQGCVGDTALNNIKRKNYIFGEDADLA